MAACGQVQESTEFRHRTELASCGQITHDQGEDVPADMLSCLDDAFDTGAELEVTFPTTEGDPIVRYYRVGPRIDGLEIFDDATQGRLGSRQWNHMICPGTVTVTDPLNCRDV